MPPRATAKRNGFYQLGTKEPACVHLCVRKVGNNEGNFQALFIILFVAVTGVELKDCLRNG